MPQLLSTKDNVAQQQQQQPPEAVEVFDKPVPNVNKPSAPLYGPPKPPRTGLVGGGAPISNMDRAEIRTALQNWQMGLMMGGELVSRGGAFRVVGENCGPLTRCL